VISKLETKLRNILGSKIFKHLSFSFHVTM